MSRPEKSAASASSTSTSPPVHGSRLPAERAEAKKRTSSAGKARSARIRRMTRPTWPVAPKTPTFMGNSLRGSSKARWSARTACSAASVRTMHEILMVEVEIMSMLIPSAARVSKVVAVTPAWDFIPAPTSETRATSSSEVTPVAPSSAQMALVTSTAASRSSLGTVKEMSVVPWTEVFWTIMSTLIDRSARGRNSLAAMPGRSGTPVTVTLASEVSWVTAVTTACSMDSSSSTTQVPGSQVKLDRTCRGTWWLRANSTERSCSTRPPVAAISSISSKLTSTGGGRRGPPGGRR